MQSIVIGRKYCLKTRHGVKVIVIAKQADESSGLSMGLVRVEIESNGMQIHVKRKDLRDVDSVKTNKRKNSRYIGLAIFGAILTLLSLVLWNLFVKH